MYFENIFEVNLQIEKNYIVINAINLRKKIS